MPFVQWNDRNILFIHIPRTGGTTVEHWMRELDELRLFSYGFPAFSKVTPQHLRYSDIRELFGENFFDYVFTIVRNPFDRLASEYRLRLKNAQEGVWSGGPCFSTWLEHRLESYQRNPHVLDNHLRPQWEFVSDAAKVFKYENGLGVVLRAIAEDIGVAPPAELAHKLSTKDVGDKIHFDIPDAERITAFYAGDFERFGYSRTPLDI
jgi:hypothetical protein